MVTNSFPPMLGGISRAAGRCAKSLRAGGHQLTISRPSLDLSGTLDRDGDEHAEALPCFTDFSRLDELAERVAEFLGSRRPDVILGYGLLPGGYVAMKLRRLLNVPAVVSVRGNDLVLNIYRWPDHVLETLAGADRVIFVATSLREYAIRLLPCLDSRSEVILNSVDIARFCPGPAEGAKQPLVGTSGIIRWKKGWDVFLRACAEIVARHPEVGIRVAGFPFELEAEAIRDQARRYGLAERVQWTGPIPADRVVDELRRMDVYLQCSYREGTPNAMLEAMAVGVAVVACEADGVLDVIRPGVDGFLVPIGAADQMAEHSLRLLEDDHLRRQVGRNARAAVERRHHPGLESDRIVEVLQRAVTPPAGPVDGSVKVGSR